MTSRERIRQQLQICYCPVCRLDTMRSDQGKCFWCNTRLYTRAEQDERRRKWRRKKARQRGRKPRVCAGCGAPVDQHTPNCKPCGDRHRGRLYRDHRLWTDDRLTSYGRTFLTETLALYPDLGNLPSSAGGPPRELASHAPQEGNRRPKHHVQFSSTSEHEPRRIHGVD